MQYTFYDFIGNIGVAAILITYLLLLVGKLRSSGLIYPALNSLGAGLVIVSLIQKFNLSAFLIEIFWLLISLYGIAKYLKDKKSPAQSKA